MLEQTVPLIRGIAELEGLHRGFAQATLIAQISECIGARGTLQLTAKPTGSEGQRTMQLIPP